MKFISLFSGIGVFDLALINAGFECDTVCEIDRDAGTTYDGETYGTYD